MERPNTVSGLQAKRKELAALHGRLTDEARKVLRDIEHVDACIKMFDPEARLHRICIERYKQPRAPKGQMKRFVMAQFRDASTPLTSRQIIAAWIADHGEPEDRRSTNILKKRIGAVIQSVKRDGLIEAVGMEGECKLWQIKR